MKKIGALVIIGMMAACGALEESAEYVKEGAAKLHDGLFEVRDGAIEKADNLAEYLKDKSMGVIDYSEDFYITLRNGTHNMVVDVRDLSYEAYLELKLALTAQDGEDGDSIKGDDGESIEGPAGSDGEKGARGRRGRRGRPGEDADFSSCYVNKTYLGGRYGSKRCEISLECDGTTLDLGVVEVVNASDCD